MNGIAFGKEIKRLRKQANITSKELSKQVGKAVTYVSQLERGLIKKPDYKTAYELLKLLQIEDQKINGILRNFGIISPKMEQEEEEWIQRQAEAASSFEWLERDKYILKKKNEHLHAALSKLIDIDFTTADKLISHIEALTYDKDKFEFLTALFEYDYTKLTSEERNKILSLIKNFITTYYTFDEYDDFIRKE